MSETDPDLVAAFRVRAREEADRYGGDPWVLVRELLQNARDAGARTVRIEATDGGEVERLAVRDDGEGLDLPAARRFLLTLYASNKGRRDQAGRFGVGFWSVLRFEPERIVVRSRPRRGSPWGLVLDGQLRPAGRDEPAPGPAGFEVVLERRARGEDLVRRVSEALRRDAPYLRRRGEASVPVEVTLNGQPTTIPFGFSPPAVVFHRRGMRGVVGLGSEPRVDLYAHGLRVRSAASLDDLLVGGGDRTRPPPGRVVGRGLAPRVLLDSDRIELLLARGDARDTRELRRLVEVARGELERLVRGQLDRWAPRPWPLRLLDRIPRPRARTLTRWRWAVVGLTAVAALATLGIGLSSQRSASGSSATPPLTEPVPYEDLAQAYRGPTVEGLGRAPAVNLAYRPAETPLLIAALVLDGLEADGSPRLQGSPVAPYPEHQCAESCVELEVGFNASSRWLRLPVPTGHRVESSSVTVDGFPVRTWATATGEALAELPAPRTGTARYRTGPGPTWPARRGGWSALPAPLARAATSLRQLPDAQRAEAALSLVRSRVRYDATPAVAARHREVARLGLGFIDRALVVGAGDCDVQNAVLAAVLHEGGLNTRLAIGFLGVGGRAAPGLHAWAEVEVGGRFWVVDASASGDGVGAAVAPGDDRPVGHSSPPALTPSPLPAWSLWGLAVAVTAAVAGAAAGALVRRGRRQLQLAGGEGLAELLRGALEQPEAFVRVTEIHTRPLVPVVGGRRVSLNRARRLEGRALYRGASGERLAVEAARCGVVVLDVATAEGRAVGDALGAVDLDWWQRLLARSERLELSGTRGLGWGGRRPEVRLAEGVGEPLRSLEVSRLDLDVVVLDRSSPLARRLVELSSNRPALAALLLVDAVAHQREVPLARRGRLLGALARAALAEEVGE